jgi:predicted transcriptional regulator
MDRQIDVETLRATLKAMARADLLEVSKEADLSHSTVDKFRRGLIKEPGVFKVQALLKAVSEHAKRAKRKATA